MYPIVSLILYYYSNTLFLVFSSNLSLYIYNKVLPYINIGIRATIAEACFHDRFPYCILHRWCQRTSSVLSA